MRFCACGIAGDFCVRNNVAGSGATEGYSAGVVAGVVSGDAGMLDDRSGGGGVLSIRSGSVTDGVKY